MNKTKLILNVTLVVGVLLFILEGASYLLFSESYKDYFRTLLDVSNKVVFAAKLLGINLLIGLFISIIFDTIYVLAFYQFVPLYPHRK